MRLGETVAFVGGDMTSGSPVFGPITNSTPTLRSFLSMLILFLARAWRT